MNTNIIILLEKFNSIRNMNYVKSINNYNSGVGLTFEKLLGKEVDCFSMPDFEGIEIKTKVNNSKTPINLFKLTPNGSDFFETKRILDLYGYYQNKNSKNKVFNATITANKLYKLRQNYFSLKLDYAKNRLIFLVFNKQKELIDDSSFWELSKIENVLLRKMKTLALINANQKIINKQKFFWYYDIKIYELIGFEKFLELLENGKISITFSIDFFKSGKRIGKFHDHGTNFGIYIKDIEKLFKKIY